MLYSLSPVVEKEPSQNLTMAGCFPTLCGPPTRHSAGQCGHTPSRLSGFWGKEAEKAGAPRMRPGPLEPIQSRNHSFYRGLGDRLGQDSTLKCLSQGRGPLRLGDGWGGPESKGGMGQDITKDSRENFGIGPGFGTARLGPAHPSIALLRPQGWRETFLPSFSW